eukprot:scaffold35375_cov78-Cyclotella_meneghiniana.AAC.1
MNFWGQYERVLSLQLSLITSPGDIFRMIMNGKILNGQEMFYPVSTNLNFNVPIIVLQLNDEYGTLEVDNE